MTPGLNWFFALRAAAVVLTAATALRLFRLGLHRKYRFFFAYLIVQTVPAAVLLGVRSGNVYAYIWFATQPGVWLLDILVVFELYSLILDRYKGLQTVGRWAFTVAVSLSALITLATLLPNWRSPNEHYALIFYYTMVRRSLCFSSVIFLLVILAFMAWYPVPLSRNLMVHSIIYPIYFLCNSLILLARNVLGSDIIRPINTALLIAGEGCFLAWILLLSRQGEKATVTMRSWQPEEEQKLVEQLSKINAALLRARRSR